MKRLRLVALVLVLSIVSAAVTSAAPADIAVPDPGSGTSTVILQNSDATQDATWSLDFVDSTGSAVSGATQNGTVKPYVATAVDTDDVSVLGTGWNGSAILSANREMAAVAYAEWTGGTSGDGDTAAEYAGFPQGYDKLTFPYSFNSNRVTWVTVQNTGSSAETFYFSFIDRRTGAQTGSTTSVSIPGGAQRTYKLNDCSSGIVPTGVCTRPSGNNEPDYWKGATIVTSTNSVVAGVATNFWYRWTGQYVGVPEAESANELIFPLFFRVRQQAGVFGEDKQFHRYSDMNIANPDTTASTEITISLYRVDGVLSKQWTTDIPAGSSVAVNTRFGGVGAPSDWATSFPADLQDSSGQPNWVGSAIVTAEAGKEIQGVCFNFWPASGQDFVVGFNALARTSGAEQLFFPVSYRTNSLAWYSQVQIQNLETTATTVDIYFYDRDATTGGVGNELYKLASINIPANSSRSMNTRFNSEGFATDWFTNLGTTFNGSVAIISQGGDVAGASFNLNVESGAHRASGSNGVVKD